MRLPRAPIPKNYKGECHVMFVKFADGSTSAPAYFKFR
jgi:hypothetical protein